MYLYLKYYYIQNTFTFQCELIKAQTKKLKKNKEDITKFIECMIK